MPDISITEIKMRELCGHAVVRSGTFTAGAHVSSLVGEAAQHRQSKKKEQEKGRRTYTWNTIHEQKIS